MTKFRLLRLLAVPTLVGTSAGAMAAPPEIDVLFSQRCTMCHAVSPAKPSGIGPNLFGVVGRKPGITNFAYSPALKALTAPWTPATLDKFLSNPAKTAPGTRMPVSVPDARQRQQIIAYLQTLHR